MESIILLAEHADTEKRLLVNLRRLMDKTVIIVTCMRAALYVCDRVQSFNECGVEETVECTL